MNASKHVRISPAAHARATAIASRLSHCGAVENARGHRVELSADEVIRQALGVGLDQIEARLRSEGVAP